MRRKLFVLFTILAIAAVSMFITNQVTQAQRPERPERGERRGGPGGPGGRGRMNPTRLIENSWAELTFAIKADDETLLKPRPTHQKAWEDIAKTVEARETGDFQGIRDEMKLINKEFMEGLKEVLTEEQLTQLKESQQKRMEREFRGRGRRGEGRHGGGPRGGDADR